MVDRRMDGALDKILDLQLKNGKLQLTFDKISKLALEREILFSAEVLEILTNPEGVFVEV